MRCDFCMGNPLEHGFDARMRHGCGNCAEAQQFACAADHLMATVEDADFHGLVRMDIMGESRACPVPIRTTGAEIILDHPLAKVFMRHRRAVLDAEILRERNLARPGGGDDAIDHGIGETALRIDPVSQRGVGQSGKAHDSLAQDCAIALQVVAAKAGERACALRPALRQGRYDRAKGRPGGLRGLRIMADIRVG